MAEFVIEKDIPGIADMSDFQQDQAVRRSCSTLHGISLEVAWLRSYITRDKVYCVFKAPSEQALRDLIEKWDLPPVLSISEVNQVIGPESGA